MTTRRAGAACVLLAVLPLTLVVFGGVAAPARAHTTAVVGASATPVANFSAAVNRVVSLLGLVGGGLLSIVWARVALSWFSHDVTKKIQAKERARDALVGTLIFTAAITGLIWGLAHWILTGS